MGQSSSTVGEDTAQTDRRTDTRTVGGHLPQGHRRPRHPTDLPSPGAPAWGRGTPRDETQAHRPDLPSHHGGAQGNCKNLETTKWMHTRQNVGDSAEAGLRPSCPCWPQLQLRRPSFRSSPSPQDTQRLGPTGTEWDLHVSWLLFLVSGTKALDSARTLVQAWGPA